MNANSFRQVMARGETARDIIARFAEAVPTLSGVWHYLDTALADVPATLTELEAVRLDRANLLAAIRATLAAHAEGEPDPLGYLRAELDLPDTPLAATRRRA